MTRQELLIMVKQVARLRDKKNKRKAKLLLSTIKPLHFFDLVIPMSTGHKVPLAVWLAYVERNWDHSRCEIYLNDLIAALESEKAEAA
jgi:hypothetical protein